MSHLMNYRALLIILLLVTTGTSEDAPRRGLWPQWRGPNRDGHSSDTNLLKRWTTAPRLVWKTTGLGIGYSSVVVADDRLYTLGRLDSDVVVFAFDIATGKQIWRAKIDETNRIPCSTPTLDGTRLYALSPDGDLCCLNTDSGKMTWRRQLMEDFGGKLQSGRGYGESPLIDDDALVCTPGGSEHTMVKLNKLTGELRWTCKAPELGTNGRDGASFSSIVTTSVAGIRQYVQMIGRGLIGVRDTNGQFLWGYNRIANPTANIPTPVVRSDLVFAANGYNAGSVLLRLKPQDAGKIQVEEVFFLNGSRFQNHHGGFVLIDDHIYGGHGSNNGLPTCLELTTGKIRWKRRGPGTGSAAVAYADGNLFFRYQDGTMALIEANSKRFRLKGKFKIPGAGNDSWPHPVVAGGILYLREKDSLLAYDVKAR